MCKWGTDEKVMVYIPSELSHTGEDRFDIKKIDKCIAPIVRDLVDAGIYTTQSCCGHGKRSGWIALYDGRELIINPRGKKGLQLVSSELSTNSEEENVLS